MKKIRNIDDLEYEKLRLRVKQLELENQMNRSWRHIKKELAFTSGGRPSTPANGKPNTGNPLLEGALNYGASFLSHKLGMIAGKKIESTAGLLLEKLAVRISSLVSGSKRHQKANRT